MDVHHSVSGRPGRKSCHAQRHISAQVLLDAPLTGLPRANKTNHTTQPPPGPLPQIVLPPSLLIYSRPGRMALIAGSTPGRGVKHRLST